jgi:hypothetical protein
MEIVGQITPNLSSPAAKVVLVIVGCVALYLAIKIGHFLLRILFGLVGLALIGLVIWWFLHRQ